MAVKVGLLTLVLAGVVAYLIFGMGGGSGLAVVDDGNGGITNVDADGVCTVEDTTVTINTVEAFNNDVTVNDVYSYRVNGGAVSTGSSGGTVTASPGDVLEVLVASNNSATSWYGDWDTVEVSCRGTQDVTLETYDMTSGDFFTVTAVNDDGVTTNGGATASTQTIGAGDVGSYEITLKGTHEDAFGVSQTGMCIEYVTASFDEFYVTDASGNRLDSIGKPSRLSTASGSTEECFVDSNFVGSGKKTYFAVYDADDSNNPNSNHTLTLMDDDYYVGNNNVWKSGFEDDTNSIVGHADQTATLYSN